MGGEDDKEKRPMSQATLSLERERLETGLKSKELDIKAKALELADKDKARDDRRALVRTVLAWTMSLSALGLIAFALYWNRAFVFKGFGIEATTGSEETVAPVPEVVPTPPAPAPEAAPMPAAPTPKPKPKPKPKTEPAPTPVPPGPAPITVPPETLDRLINLLAPPAPVPEPAAPVPAPEPATPVPAPEPAPEPVVPAPEPEPEPEPELVPAPSPEPISEPVP